MVNRILRCPVCGSYALTEQCPCGGARIPPRPPKYSPDDKYAEYRRRYKELHLEEKS
jgi:H/ACA ribonucleoprotein complex subunit 3